MCDPQLLSQLAEYSWCDIAKAAKAAMVMTALGGRSFRINGREFEGVSMADAQSLYELAVEQIANEQNPGDGGIILAVLNDGPFDDRRRRW